MSKTIPLVTGDVNASNKARTLNEFAARLSCLIRDIIRFDEAQPAIDRDCDEIADNLSKSHEALWALLGCELLLNTIDRTNH